MKKFLTLLLSTSCIIACSPAVTSATDPAYSLKDNSVTYFNEPEEIIVSTKHKFTLDRFSGRYGFIFKAQEDGIFVLTKKNGSDAETNIIKCENGKTDILRVFYYTSKNSDNEIIALSNEYLETDGNRQNYFIYYDCIDDNKNRSEFVITPGYVMPLADYNCELPIVRASENSQLARTEYAPPYAVSSQTLEYYIFEPVANGTTTFTFPYEDSLATYIITAQNGKYIPSLNIVSDCPATFGDINNDGIINISDVVMLQKYLLATADFTPAQFLTADINSDGNVNVFDFIELRKRVIEK